MNVQIITPTHDTIANKHLKRAWRTSDNLRLIRPTHDTATNSSPTAVGTAMIHRLWRSRRTPMISARGPAIWAAELKSSGIRAMAMRVTQREQVEAKKSPVASTEYFVKQ